MKLLKLDSAQWADYQFEIAGRRYEGFGRVSIHQKDEIQKLKQDIFFKRASHVLYKQIGLEFDENLALAVSPDGQQVKPVIEIRRKSLNVPDKDTEEKIELLSKIGLAIKAIFGEADIHRPMIYSENGRMMVTLSSALWKDPLMSLDIDIKKVFTHLDEYGVGSEHYKLLQQVLHGISADEISSLASEFGMPSAFVRGFEKRRVHFQNSLADEIAALFGDPKTMVAKARKNFQVNSQLNGTEVLRFIKDKFRRRLDRDFQQHTVFKNFEDYKNYVMKFPEYRQIIEEFRKSTVLSINRHRLRRSSILTGGFKNLFETGTSSIGKGTQFEEYGRGRLAAEAEGLGLSVEDYQRMVPATYRAKSAFVLDSSQMKGSESRYGTDNYFSLLQKLLEDPKAPLVTMTIGDSLDDSFRWYSKPLLAEDFPYLAAPFIHDAQRRLNRKTLSTVNYRGSDSIGHFPEVAPVFFGNLDKMLKVHLRTDINGLFESMNLPMIYTEAQVHGYFGIGNVHMIALKASDKVPEELLETYRLLGIQVIRY
ncbi:MAG: hypothetical protein NDJ89_03245 [Oligoflexia bacterium]|nr:hypothetical protein [Oligoflexia bacterium]